MDNNQFLAVLFSVVLYPSVVSSSLDLPVKISKNHNPYTEVYEVTDVITFDDVINSSYKPISISDFVNPANKDVVGKYNCKTSAKIKVYRDEDYVYYYSINKSELGCLNNIGGDYDTVISNLPEGYSCK